MGMSAAQAKLLSLTARRSDINYQLSSLMRGKLDLMTQASNATDMLSNAQRNNNIFVMTTSDNTQTELSFNSLSKEGLTIVDAKGRTIVPSSYQTNPNKLASILPTSHPSIKSYDGDFIVKEKIKKNYVSMPQNTIPIFENIQNGGDNTKQVVATTDKTSSELISIKDLSTMYTSFCSAILSVDANSQHQSLASQFAQNEGMGFVISKNNSFADYKPKDIADVANANKYEYGNYNIYANQNCTNSDKLAEILNENFGSEFGKTIDITTDIGKLNNLLMGGSENSIKSYTKYENRKFQSANVSWQDSKNVINSHIKKRNTGNTDITYVSNAEQLITALLKDATYDDDKGISSNANIMLLNDIDLDDMLGDKMKEFLIKEIRGIADCSNFDGSNFSSIENKLTDSAENPNSKIKGNVLKAIWNKYFSGDGTKDKFNENFTNFIQIDNFTGAIGGGGFAINNLKMAATSGAASMFGTLDNATLHGIYMENANVIGYNINSNVYNGAILAQKVQGNSCTLLTVQGDGITSDNVNDVKNLSINSETVLFNTNDNNQVRRFVGLVGQDLRGSSNLNEVKDSLGVGYNNISSNAGAYYSTGWTYNMGDNAYFPNNSSLGTISMGIRTDNKCHDAIICSSKTNNDIADIYSVKQAKGVWQNYTNDVRQVTTNEVANEWSASAALLYAAGDLCGQIGDSENVTNNSLYNGKIRLYQTKDTDTYKDPGVDGSWKENAKFEDGTEVDWNVWEICPNTEFDSENGTYTLSRKHGEETEEYLEVMSLLEFYKEQGVNVEFDEDKDSGFLTYSFSGYSVDVEYKDDLEKFYSDPYLYKVENGDSSIVIYEREKIQDVDMSQLLFVDDIESVLSQNIKNGIWFLQGASIDDPSKYERKSLDEIGIVETDDENANAIAQAEYEKSMRDIELKEEKLDAQITELESTLKAVEQEIENQEKIIKQNIQSGFSTFAS